MASISKNSSGNWRVQLEHHGQREYKTFKSKSLALRWSVQRQAELQRGLLATVDDAQKTFLREIIARYREKVLPHKRNRGYRWSLNLLEDRFGETRLISLQSKDIANFRDERLNQGLAPATVVKELNLLRILIDYAIKEVGIYLPANPARMVKNPSVNNARDRVLTATEEAQLFAAFTQPMLPVISTLALETACRLGELLSLRWQDVDFQKHIAHIRFTKTDTPRYVPLSSRALNTLTRLDRPIEGGRIFRCWARPDSFQNVFRRAVKRAGLINFRFHDLRHMATSRLAQKVPNVIELSRITGHTDLKMLSRYYHITAEDLAMKLG